MASAEPPFDPQRDLCLERLVEIPPRLVWRAWTEPEYLKAWFTPFPWTTIEAEIDLRPGGIFRTVMRSPEGRNFDNAGCYLEVVANERLVWTSALGAGFRPAPHDPTDLAFTAVISLAPAAEGTRYRALAIHRSETDRQKHEQMGFHSGWGKALDQLVAHMRNR
jgi:uncharacterized protein YndB with AHSA1/START domain